MPFSFILSVNKELSKQEAYELLYEVTREYDLYDLVLQLTSSSISHTLLNDALVEYQDRAIDIFFNILLD